MAPLIASMRLLLDLGLRASEVASLTVEAFAEPGYVTVYRQSQP